MRAGGPDRLADELAARLTAVRRRRLGVHDVMGLMLGLRPELATASDRSRRLADVLEDLERRGVVEGSKGRTQVHGVEIPRSVIVLAADDRSAPENPARRFPWVETMAWAAEGPRRPAKVHDRLCRLSEWIASNPRSRVVPVRERSVKIFGGSKVLEHLLDGVLRDHPATVTALAVERVHPPMVLTRIGGAVGRAVLIVENHTTYHSVAEASRAHAAAGAAVDFGWVGYGAGEQLGAIVPSLTELAPAALLYFGDLDPEGLRFAAAGARSCQEVGLPALRPSPWLYAALLERGQPQRKPTPWPEDGLAWLGSDLAEHLRRTLGNGQWLEQEAVGIESLSADSGWCVVPDRTR